MSNNNGIKLLTVEEVAETLMISKTIAYNLVKNNEIKAFKIGTHWRIPIDSVNEYINKKMGE